MTIFYGGVWSWGEDGYTPPKTHKICTELAKSTRKTPVFRISVQKRAVYLRFKQRKKGMPYLASPLINLLM